MSGGKKGFVNLLQEFSIPLIAGVVVAVLFANVDYGAYHRIVEFGPLDGLCGDSENFFCQELHHEGDDAHADDAHADDAHADDAHADDAHADDEAHAADETDVVPDEAVHPAEAGHTDAPTPEDVEAEHGAIKVFTLFGHHLTLHFIINDIFMLLFFGVAAKEITESVLPGGALNPPSKAVNPILGTLGGVIGPIAVYLVLATLLVKSGTIFTDAPAEAFSRVGAAFTPGGVFAPGDPAAVYRGWGVPTATDIALAWLVARLVFGASHPAVNFLLLLAIADDAIGLGIIAVFYPNPAHPPAPQFLALVALGMAAAWGMRKAKVTSWVPYILVGGLLSWLGLLNAALHPALALVPIVPFLPGPTRDTGMFADLDDVGELEETFTGSHTSVSESHSALHNFEHSVKIYVDFGLFFFGFANAGVAFASITPVTYVVFAALLFGKLIGITLFSWAGNAAGFKYPAGMTTRHVVIASLVAGMGLTVALFVAGEAFPGTSPHQGPAKMGALFSAGAGIIAIVLGRVLGAKKLDESGQG